MEMIRDEPKGSQGLAPFVQALYQDAHNAVAAQAQPPDQVLGSARVIFDKARRSAFHNLKGMLGHIPLQAAAADRSRGLARLAYQHTRARPPVDRAFDADDSCQRRPL